jgi:hypothetical protein
MAEPRELVAQMTLQGLGEQTAAQDIAVPETSVFHQEPAVDPARGCAERLRRRLGHVGAESPSHAYRHTESVPAL